MDIQDVRRAVLQRLVSDRANGNKAEFGRAYDIDPSYLSQMLGGHRAIGEKSSHKLEGKIGLPTGYLDDLNNASFIAGQEQRQHDQAAPAPVLRKDELTIPQFATGGMGGNGLVLMDQPGIIENWTVSQEWVRANVPYCSSPANLCIVTGFGDSMPDMYSPGDPVLVDRGVRVCDHDGVFFFRVGDEGFIKRLQRIPGEGIRVISQNKEYETWTIKPDMNFEVFGKVLKAWKGKTY